MDVSANGTVPSSPAFDQALAHFLASNEVGIVSVSITAIVNIIKNILSNPKDAKLRTLQKSNKNIMYKITNPPGCRELMSAMGWSLVGESYILPQNVPLTSLTMTKIRLEQQLEAAERVIEDIPRIPCHAPKDLDVVVPLVKSARFEVCVGSTVGRRPTMEDEVVVVGLGPAHNPNEDFFGVFDGHGGRDAAVYAAKNLYPKIGRNFSLNPNEPLKSITSAFEETNAWMMQQRMDCGSTAAVGFVVESTLYTANVGDTRVVLGYKDRRAVRLSFDHKPSVASEKERIERLGGEVTKKFGVARVNGVLGVSRAFGDCKLIPYVSAVPHINILELTDETMFLIIACDGLWDEFSDKEAVDLVFEKANSVQNMAEYLTNMAIMRGSQDNVSVVVVFLNPRRLLYEEEEEDEEDEEDDDSEVEGADANALSPEYDEEDDEEDDEDDDNPIMARFSASLLTSPPPSGPPPPLSVPHSAPNLPPPPSLKSTNALMSRTLISSGSNTSTSQSSQSSTDFAPRSIRAMVVTEDPESSSSDDENAEANVGLGVGSLSAWVELDDSSD
jgi:serine/threonine protein phosphatase PrpC